MIADLPGAITRLSVELIQQSKCVFIVSTPEIASLHMARVRIRQLQDLGLGPQLRLLINRVEKKSPVRVEEVVSAVGLPIHAQFDNDYPEAQKIFLGAAKIPESRDLGRQIAAFAQSLSRRDVVAEPPRKKRFLEVFSLAR